MVLTHEIPPAFHDGVHIYTVNRHRVSSEFIGSRSGVPMASIAESPPGTVPLVLKVVRVTGAAFSDIIIYHFLCASLSPHPLKNILVCTKY